MIFPSCKVFSKVSHKIYETQKLTNVVIQFISLYQTNQTCSHLHLLVCFLLPQRLQCSRNIYLENFQKQLNKLIHSYDMKWWVCYKGVWWWFFLFQQYTWGSQSGAAGGSVFTGTTELFCNAQTQLSGLRHVKSRCFHCATCRWILSAWW